MMRRYWKRWKTIASMSKLNDIIKAYLNWLKQDVIPIDPVHDAIVNKLVTDRLAGAHSRKLESKREQHE